VTYEVNNYYTGTYTIIRLQFFLIIGFQKNYIFYSNLYETGGHKNEPCNNLQSFVNE